MTMMKQEYMEHIYAGWLAKIIGIRMGAPIEGWSSEMIQNIYGELTGYPVDYREFAADDDSNGPLFFLRALEDSGHGADMTAQDVAEALLNYAPFEHGFFWWGGYGVSTEHTAYLNLRNGMKAPESGSILQNGHATAEQIGGQIFVDTWGLVTPGNPDLAASLAAKAASVTHDGNGIYGGVFIAACISCAFVEKDISRIIEKGLSYLPADCEYVKTVRIVMDFHDKHPKEWRSCLAFLQENYGYDKYPGMCHIIPNSAVMILGLLYGDGDFSDTLNICNMCGWDTDCNVGNVATIMGVRNGLEGIDYDKWRAPINDFLACSSVMGSLNIMDIPYGAAYIIKLACMLSGEKVSEPWKEILKHRIDSCHFEFPGSTHAMRVRLGDGNSLKKGEYSLKNTQESAMTGTHSLKLQANQLRPGEHLYVFKKTYYRPEDFHDSRYDPSFSPLAYPGQTLHGSVMWPGYGAEVLVSLYCRELHTGKIYEGPKHRILKGQWEALDYRIPPMEGALIGEAGYCFYVAGEGEDMQSIAGLMDDFYIGGVPEYSICMRQEQEEVWNMIHREISQFTRLKGLFYLEENLLHLSCFDFGEVYTGRHDWKDYRAEFVLIPINGEHHLVNVRVQGAIRSYAAGLLPGGKAGLLKNKNGYEILASADFPWKQNQEYKIEVTAEGNLLKLTIDGQPVLEYRDEDAPYLEGAVGISVQKNSHCGCKEIRIQGISRE